jgi:hypothetical protein
MIDSMTPLHCKFYSTPEVLRQQQSNHDLVHNMEFIDANLFVSDTTLPAATNDSLLRESEDGARGLCLSMRLISAVSCFFREFRKV